MRSILTYNSSTDPAKGSVSYSSNQQLVGLSRQAWRKTVLQSNLIKGLNRKEQALNLLLLIGLGTKTSE